MASVTGTLSTAGTASGVFFLRAGETASVILTVTGTATVQLQGAAGQPAQAYRDLQAFTATTTGTLWKNTTGASIYLRLYAVSLGGGSSVAYTVEDVAGDQVLEEWRAADGTLAFRITDQGPMSATGPSLDVLAFGAKGDGVTDDTAAIQAAIDAAEARGGGIVQGRGGDTYRITSGLTITENYVVLDLDYGLLYADFATGWAVTVGTGTGIRRGNGVRNAFIYTDNVSTSINGVRFLTDTRYQTVYENLRIESFKGTGMQFDGLNWSIQQSVAPLIRFCGVGLIIENNTNAITLAGIGVDDCDTYNVILRGTVSATFVGGYNQFAGTAGVLMETGTVGSMQEAWTSSFYGVYFEGNGGSHIIGNNGRGLVVSGCLLNCANMTGPCIDLNNWDGAFIEGNLPANLSSGTQRDFVDADASCTLIDVGRQAVTTQNDLFVSVQGGSVVGLINGAAKRYSTLPTPNVLSLGSLSLLAGSGTGVDRALPWMAIQTGSGVFEYRQMQMALVKQAATSVTSPFTPPLATRGILDITVSNTGLTINAPSGAYDDGEEMVFLLRQNATGGGNITWDAAYCTDLSNTGNTAEYYASVTFRWSAGRSRWVQTGKLAWTV